MDKLCKYFEPWSTQFDLNLQMHIQSIELIALNFAGYQSNRSGSFGWSVPGQTQAIVLLPSVSKRWWRGSRATTGPTATMDEQRRCQTEVLVMGIIIDWYPYRWNWTRIDKRWPSNNNGPRESTISYQLHSQRKRADLLILQFWIFSCRLSCVWNLAVKLINYSML